MAAKTQEQLVADYHTFIQSQTSDSYTLEQSSPDQYLLKTDYASAQIDFWDDIVEFNVVSVKTDDNVFALHFQLLEEDWDHCEELFGEMIVALLDQQNQHTVRVLLSCTAGMTTFMFAQQLNQAAKNLSLDYEFNAVPVTQLYEEGMSYDAILLAPQVAFQYDTIAEIFNDKPVIQIPTQMFASYDTGGCLQMVREKLEEAKHTKAARAVYKIMRGIDQDARILSIVLRRSYRKAELLWRIYDNGEVLDEGSVVKTQSMSSSKACDSVGFSLENNIMSNGAFTLSDIKDLICSVYHTSSYGKELDAIGIAFIGSIDNGQISLSDTFFDGINLEQILENKFHVPVVVANNVNAAALGWYAQQDTYNSVVFHSQSRGLYVGGQGIVFNGHLIEGKNSLAGEIRTFYPMISSDLNYDPKENHYGLWDPKILTDLLARIFSIDVGIVAPEVICVRSELTPDMEPIREALSAYVPREQQPELVYVPDFVEYASLGMVILAMKRLRLAA